MLAQSDIGLVHLPDDLPANHSREVLPGDTDLDTAQTISRMQDMVTLGKREFEKRKLLQNFVFDCPAKDYYCYAKGAHNFCRDQIRYVFDPSGVELIENPVRILESRVADCDSIVILMATLCEQMGFPCRFVTIKADKGRPDDWSHVFLEVNVPGKGWVGSDPTQPDKDFGWEPGAEYPRRTWPASKDTPEGSKETDEMAGLGAHRHPSSPGHKRQPGHRVLRGIALSGLAGPIPGVQDTPGVIVEKPWQWRDEPAFITVHPEQLELNTFGNRPPTPTPMPGDNFYFAEDLTPLFDHDPESDAVSMTVVTDPVKETTIPVHMKGLGANDVPSWVWLVGGAALLYWWMKK